MRNHTKIYLKYHSLKSDEFDHLFIPCEWCGARATDINHIEARKMGGSKTKDFIENLMAMCRPCHTRFERKEISREEALKKHLKTL